MNKVMGMERKVTKFGNSLGITMTEALKQLGLEQGDSITVDVRQEEGEIVIRKAAKVTLPAGISADFMDTLSHVLKEYDETIKRLKDR